MENSRRFLTKLKIEIPYDPAIPPLAYIEKEKHGSKRHEHSTVHCNAVCNSQDVQVTYMSINRWMDKEDMNIYKRILFNYLKEWNNDICSSIDGIGDYHNKWSKSDGARQISFDIAYMQNLKNDRNNLFTKNKQTHRHRIKFLVMKGKGWWGRDKLGVWGWHIKLLYLK